MTHADAVRTLAAERYLLDEMPEIERYAFEEHYFDCAECADDLRAGSTMRKAVKQRLLPDVASGAAASMPPAVATRSRTSSVVLPWAAAAVLAVAVGYQALVPPSRLPVQALNPITLRPDSRGAVPTVTLDGDAVALTLDVDAPAGSGLTYVLQTASGTRVAEGKLSTPPAGAPLLLLVPVWTLTPSTQYSLAVQGATDGRIVGEYRFAVAAR
jgi:anti-sigma factor RsiW